jgi:menaquinone-dependent protoporphyrinogen oxidase
MKPVLVLYATREGQTRSIAEYLAAIIRTRCLMASVVNAAKLPTEFGLEDYSMAILAASVHRERHESEMIDFVKQHRAALEAMPSAFLSVSLSEAGVEDDEASPDRRAAAAVDVCSMIDKFLAETGWHPSKIKAVAGALMYTKYNFLVRLVMKHIAHEAGASTDTSHDHVLTDWAALDVLADDLVRSFSRDGRLQATPRPVAKP